MTPAAFRRAVPGSHFSVDSRGEMVSVLNRPSWLLYGHTQLELFLRLFYLDPFWVSLGIADLSCPSWFTRVPASWEECHHCMHSYIAANGILGALWVNTRV